ncbi:hypothetical protein AAFF_G00265470 [Aldrovandia affinis]|uniref:Solute carrier family 43 member 3 n=1 Tax=Aldrovandia affinis TaxID=143900 RepID=A0AAD7RBP9_9TELE|nr:hypothetical protein AAFF_G00265470 [Aldrovandia affinis]
MLVCQFGGMLRWVTLLSGLVECLFFTGISLGWASLAVILKREGYFSDHCINATGANSSMYTDCSGQGEQLSLVFTIAFMMSSFLTLPNGFFFDYFGTMATRILAIMSCCGQSNSVEQQGGSRAETTVSNGIVQRERGAVLQAGDTQPSENTAAHVMSFRSCVLSWFFLLHLVWVLSSYTNAFAFTQLCGILCAPLNGLIIGRNKGKPRAPGETEKEADLSSSVLSLFLTVLLCLLFSICASIPVLPLQYLTFVLQVLAISFLLGGNSSFVRIAFPSCHYGKLYGLILCLSGMVLLLQFPLTILVNDVLQGNPLYVNIGLIILSLLAFFDPLYVYLHCRRQAAHRLSLNS